MTISTNQFKSGMNIEVDKTIYTIVEFQHVKPGKGGAFVRTKLKNFKTGSVLDKTFRAGEKFTLIKITTKEMQYLYQSGDEYYLMDNETFEQISIRKEDIGEAAKYLKEGMVVGLQMLEGKMAGVDLPLTVELEVVRAEPGMKGDTATGGTKPVTLETGLTIQVPLFISEGDVLKIDTRTGKYLGKA
ncbi:MAG: elongation factor P [bacterium]|nr:elongation factor P [bacterium]